MKKIIRQPETWQDFESLCKKLWEEIWDCAEIKKIACNGKTMYISNKHIRENYDEYKNSTKHLEDYLNAF